MEESLQNEQGGKRKISVWKIILWVIAVLVGVALVIQYINAEKYESLVQVMEEDKVGVNPRGERLDFGDLPRGKSAVQVVTLESSGNTPAYVMVWNRGEMGDFLKVSRNFFTLEPGKTEKLEFTTFIPNSAEFRYYYGKVVIFQIPKIW